MASGQVVDVARIIDEQKMGPLHWQGVALAFVLMLIDGYDIVCVAYVAPLLRQQWGFPPAALGPLFGSGLLGAALGPIIFGYLGDKIGRKPTILSGALWFGVFTTAAVWATSLNQLMLLRLIAGCGIGGVLAAQLMGTYGWQIVFWIGGLVPILLAVIGYFIFPESIKFLTLRPHRRTELLTLIGGLSPGLKIDPDARLVLGDEANAPSFSFKALFDGRLAWGTCFGIGRFGSVVGPVLAGILIGMNLSINTLFYIAGALMILGVVVGIALVPLYRQQLEDLQKSGAPVAGRTEALKPAE